MEITFQGIIVHMKIRKDNVEQQVAVLLNAPDHAAKLAYNLKDVTGGGGSGYVCVPLSGCVTTDAGVGIPKIIEIHDIPELTKTTTAKVGDESSELLKCPPDATQIAAIVFLPPYGRLTCEHYFDNEVDFGSTPYGPLPETVTYAVKPSKTTIKIQYGPKASDVVELQDGAKINVTNVCPPPKSGAPPHHHFQHYKNLFKTPGSVTVYDPKFNSTICTFASRPDDMPSCTGARTLDVDCVNSRFP